MLEASDRDLGTAKSEHPLFLVNTGESDGLAICNTKKDHDFISDSLDLIEKDTNEVQMKPKSESIVAIENSIEVGEILNDFLKIDEADTNGSKIAKFVDVQRTTGDLLQALYREYRGPKIKSFLLHMDKDSHEILTIGAVRRAPRRSSAVELKKDNEANKGSDYWGNLYAGHSLGVFRFVEFE